MSYKGIVIAGQSNAKTAYAYDRVDWGRGNSNLYQFKQDGTITLATQEMDFPDGKAGQPFGAYVVNLVRDYFIPNDPTSNYCILPEAYGGTGFYQHWEAPSGTQYANMLAQINSFLAHDVGNTIKLFIWQHGEEDVADSGAGLGNYSGNNSTNAQITGVYQAYFKTLLDDLHTNVTGGFNSVPKLIGNQPPDLVYNPATIGFSADGTDHHNSGAVPIYDACSGMPTFLGASTYNIAYIDPLNPTKLQCHASVATDSAGTIWLSSGQYWIHYSQDAHRHLAHRAWKAYQKAVLGVTPITLGW